MSQVLLKKYTDVAIYAHFAEHRYAAAFPAELPPPGLADLRHSLSKIAIPGHGVRGLFMAGNLRNNLELVFGEPPSWRWLLPLRAGGPGNPLQPSTFINAAACEAWAQLAAALELHHTVMRIQMQMESELESQQAQRVQTLLKSVERSAGANTSTGEVCSDGGDAETGA